MVVQEVIVKGRITLKKEWKKRTRINQNKERPPPLE